MIHINSILPNDLCKLRHRENLLHRSSAACTANFIKRTVHRLGIEKYKKNSDSNG